MYESPIGLYHIADKVVENFNMQVEEYIIQALARYDVHINKSELMAALAYDRNQYEKGYKDGFKAAKEEALKNLKENIQMLCGQDIISEVEESEV